MQWPLVSKWLIACILLVAPVGLTQPTSEEFNKLLHDIESLKAGQKAISNDLQEIKKLLAGRGAERAPGRDINTTLTITDAFSQGDPQAPLTLVEFTDYQ
jgi:protein-disulfide isomerase